MINPAENPVLAAHLFSNMLRDPEREVVRTEEGQIEKLINVNQQDRTVEIERYALSSKVQVPVAEMSMDGFRYAEEFKNEIRYTPEFWNSQLLTSDEISEICKWLMTLQAAHVMADSVMDGETEVKDDNVEFYKHNYRKGLDNCCKLVRHLSALKKGVY